MCFLLGVYCTFKIYSVVFGATELLFYIHCKDENLDHNIGIYCNLIGPLAVLRHCAFSCKKILRYFGKV